MKLLPLSALLLLALPLAAPSAAATTCAQVHLGHGVFTFFDGEVGTGCLGGDVYRCDWEWYGGHGLLGGFVFTCSPWIALP